MAKTQHEPSLDDVKQALAANLLPYGQYRQAIVTHYLGPTNVRGSRIKATAQAGSVTLHYASELDTFDNHARAAVALANRFGWLECQSMVSGALPDGSYVFCMVTKQAPSSEAS